MLIAVPKGRTVTSKFFKNAVLKIEEVIQGR